jgi:hypothetical protein
MAARETRTVDARARVTLPPRFAKATVILEQVSESEVRIRRTGGRPDEPAELAEETITTLSDRDRDRFLRLLEDPSPPNAALRKAMSRRRKYHG